MDPSAPAYNRPLGLIATVAGAALFALAFWGTGETGPMPVHWPEWMATPVHFTVLFALPLGLFLMKTGRLTLRGLIWFIVAMTLAHRVAMGVAISVAISNDHGHTGGLLGGAAGGAAGAVGTWIMLMLMGANFRTGRAVALMLVATVLLTALGAYGVGVGSISNLMALIAGREYQSSELDPSGLVTALYLPWQIVYGLALMSLFEPHRAR